MNYKDRSFKSTINRNIYKNSKLERMFILFPFLTLAILMFMDFFIRLFSINTLNENLYKILVAYIVINISKLIIYPNFRTMLKLDFQINKIIKNQFEKKNEEINQYEKLPKITIDVQSGILEISLIKNGNVDMADFENLTNKFEQISGKLLISEYDERNNYTLVFKNAPEPLKFASKSLANARYYQLDTDYEHGLKWDIKEDPHMLLVASTGQGKSVFLNWLITQIASTGSIINMIDIKNELKEDMRANLASYETTLDRCSMIIRQEVEHMNKRNAGEEEKDVQRFLILEEFQSFSTQLEMSNPKEYKKMIENIQVLLITARAVNITIIMVCQDGSTETIPSKIRNNMSFKMYLGRPTKEQAVQLFGTGAKELPKLPNMKGAGYVKSNLSGSKIQKYVTPRLGDHAKPKNGVRK